MMASELKLLARDWLRGKYPQAVIVFELSIGEWGSSSLDVAAITADAIIGVEVKGEGDSPARLKLQAASYSKSATHMWLLPCPSLQNRCENHRPLGWGTLRVHQPEDGGEPSLFPAYEHIQRLPTAPAQLVQALWADEVRCVVSASLNHIPTGKFAKGRHGMAELLAEYVPLAVLRPLVCKQLLRRPWLLKYPSDRISLPASTGIAA